MRLQSTNRRRLSSFAEKATSKGGEISDGVLWDREVEMLVIVNFCRKTVNFCRKTVNFLRKSVNDLRNTRQRT